MVTYKIFNEKSGQTIKKGTDEERKVKDMFFAMRHTGLSLNMVRHNKDRRAR